ncbi:putative beta-glucosidase [Helianthus annuus]|nr:putative beta-glucosidase [Helianthus annuus]KAJ0797446.1 putative beta-glucosidase [Helianthus annuus]
MPFNVSSSIITEVSCLAEFKKLERLDLTFNNLLSHEVEGAVLEDGRTCSIWDKFAHAGNNNTASFSFSCLVGTCSRLIQVFGCVFSV